MVDVLGQDTITTDISGYLDVEDSISSPREYGTAGHPAEPQRLAIQLAWLQRFAEEHQIYQRGLTTAQVVSELVKPFTAAGADRRSYAQHLLDESDPATADTVSQGRPFYFVSHAWSRPFAETLGLLVHHFAPEQQRLWRRRDDQPLPPLAADEVFVWLDVFANDQHGSGDPDQQQAPDLASLAKVVRAAEETLLVMDPERGAALGRLWCLWEAWQACSSSSGNNGNNGVGTGRGGLRVLLYDAEFQHLEKAFTELDVSRAQATRLRDTDALLRDLEASACPVPAAGHPGHAPGPGLTFPPLASGPGRPDVKSTACGGHGGGNGSSGSGASGGGALHNVTARLKAALVAGALAQVPYGADVSWTADVGTTLAVVARLCMLYGRLHDAEPLLRRDAVGAECCLGPDHPRTLTALEGLAVLLTARRDFGRAEPLWHRAAEGWARACGPEHPNTLAATHHLATVLLALQQYDKAEPLLRTALYGMEIVLGSEHVATAAAAANLAALLRSQGRYGEAVPLYRQALASHERALGPDHPETVAVLTALAALLNALRDYTSAAPLYERVLAARERTLGPAHEDTLTALSCLGSTLLPLGRLEEAEGFFRRALAGREVVLGSMHYRTLASVHNLACLLAARGKYTEAEPLCRRAVAGREGLLGRDHPETRGSVWNLALLLKCLGRWADAEAVFRRALEDRIRLLGGSHVDTHEGMHCLAEVLLYSGAKYDEAEGLFRRAAEGREGLLSGSHPDTLASVSGLAGLMVCRGRHEEAEGLYRRVVAGREQRLGPGHLETLAATHSLAELLAARGKYAEAEGLFRRAVDGRRGVLGAGHSLTLASACGLGCLLVYRGRYDEAAQVYKQLVLGDGGPPGQPSALQQQHQHQQQLSQGRESIMSSRSGPLHNLACVLNLAAMLSSCGKHDVLDAAHRKELAARAGAGAGGGSGGGAGGDPWVSSAAFAPRGAVAGALGASAMGLFQHSSGQVPAPSSVARPSTGLVQHWTAGGLADLLPPNQLQLQQQQLQQQQQNLQTPQVPVRPGPVGSSSLPATPPTPHHPDSSSSSSPRATIPQASSSHASQHPSAYPRAAQHQQRPARQSYVSYGRSVELPRNRGLPLTASWPNGGGMPSCRPNPNPSAGLVGWASAARGAAAHPQLQPAVQQHHAYHTQKPLPSAHDPQRQRQGALPGSDVAATDTAADAMSLSGWPHSGGLSPSPARMLREDDADSMEMTHGSAPPPLQQRNSAPLAESQSRMAAATTSPGVGVGFSGPGSVRRSSAPQFGVSRTRLLQQPGPSESSSSDSNGPRGNSAPLAFIGAGRMGGDGSPGATVRTCRASTTDAAASCASRPGTTSSGACRPSVFATAAAAPAASSGRPSTTSSTQGYGGGVGGGGGRPSTSIVIAAAAVNAGRPSTTTASDSGRGSGPEVSWRPASRSTAQGRQRLSPAGNSRLMGLSPDPACGLSLVRPSNVASVSRGERSGSSGAATGLGAGALGRPAIGRAALCQLLEEQSTGRLGGARHGGAGRRAALHGVGVRAVAAAEEAAAVAAVAAAAWCAGKTAGSLHTAVHDSSSSSGEQQHQYRPMHASLGGVPANDEAPVEPAVSFLRETSGQQGIIDPGAGASPESSLPEAPPGADLPVSDAGDQPSDLFVQSSDSDPDPGSPPYHPRMDATQPQELPARSQGEPAMTGLQQERSVVSEDSDLDGGGGGGGDEGYGVGRPGKLGMDGDRPQGGLTAVGSDSGQGPVPPVSPGDGDGDGDGGSGGGDAGDPPVEPGEAAEAAAAPTTTTMLAAVDLGSDAETESSIGSGSDASSVDVASGG